jgi:hypothetical protein
MMNRNKVSSWLAPFRAVGVGPEAPMRRWFLPLTVVGLGGVGAFLLSERGRETLRALWERFQDSPDGWQDLNDSVQSELDRIQAALDRIAESIDPRPQMGQ